MSEITYAIEYAYDAHSFGNPYIERKCIGFGTDMEAMLEYVNEWPTRNDFQYLRSLRTFEYLNGNRTMVTEYTRDNAKATS